MGKDQRSLLDLLGGGEEKSEDVVSDAGEECEYCLDSDAGEANEGCSEKPEEKKDKSPQFDDSWVVFYAGKTRLVRNLGLKKHNEKSLKAVLAKEFPEFGVVKTVFNYDQKKKVIVPVVVGDRKGAACEVYME